MCISSLAAGCCKQQKVRRVSPSVHACCVLQVRTRFESEQGISFTEFTYQLLQGYDFVHLCKEHGVRVQVSNKQQRL